MSVCEEESRVQTSIEAESAISVAVEASGMDVVASELGSRFEAVSAITVEEEGI